MVKTLKEVRIQPGPSVRFEQGEKFWTALCEKRASQIFQPVEISSSRLWKKVENKSIYQHFSGILISL